MLKYNNGFSEDQVLAGVSVFSLVKMIMVTSQDCFSSGPGCIGRPGLVLGVRHSGCWEFCLSVCLFVYPLTTYQSPIIYDN